MLLNSVQASQKTNLQILESVYFDICRDVVASRNFADTSCVIEKSSTITEYNWVIEKQFFACLNAVGVKHVYSDALVEDAARISYKSIKHDLYYQKVKDKKSERHIDIELHVRLVDSKNSILHDDIVKRTKTDTLFTKELKNMEDINYPFTIGKKNQSFLKRVYEPVLITMITGWIIYLFYSYRSQ
jgi:hypothetical protein